MGSVGGKIAGSFGLGLLILLDANHWVVHTYQVIGTLANILTLLDDAETGQRGEGVSHD